MEQSTFSPSRLKSVQPKNRFFCQEELKEQVLNLEELENLQVSALTIMDKPWSNKRTLSFDKHSLTDFISGKI